MYPWDLRYVSSIMPVEVKMRSLGKRDSQRSNWDGLGVSPFKKGGAEEMGTLLELDASKKI